MVSAITTTAYDPLAYLQQIKGVAPVAATTNNAPSVPSSSGENSGSNTLSLVNSLLGLSSESFSVLQGTTSSTSTSNVFSALLGAQPDTTQNNKNALRGVYESLAYAAGDTSVYSDAIKAILAQEQKQNTTSSLSDAFSSRQAAYNSYNQTLIQTAQEVLKSYQPNAGTNLVT